MQEGQQTYVAQRATMLRMELMKVLVGERNSLCAHHRRQQHEDGGEFFPWDSPLRHFGSYYKTF